MRGEGEGCLGAHGHEAGATAAGGGAQGTRGLGTAQACGPLSNVTACSPALLSFPEDLEGGPPSKKMKLEASQQSSEEM